MKAGEQAPMLVWTKIVASSPETAGPGHLAGQTTVLLFLPPVSHNKQTVGIWNDLVERFADRSINFVWIAKEEESSLIPFLKNRTVRGWLLLDPDEKSYQAYGVEGASGVLIDSRGTIAGFTSGCPRTEQIEAVLEGRAIAVDGEATENQLDAFFEGKAVRLEARPFRPPHMRGMEKPDVPPSENVYISESQTNGTISSTASDHWVRRGFELKAILAEILGTGPVRVELPAALDEGARYDFVFVPPREEDRETIRRRVRAGIENHFRVSITCEARSTNVYVIRRVEGRTPPETAEDEAFGGASFSTSRIFAVPAEFRIPEGPGRTRKAVEEANRQAIQSPEFHQAMKMAQLTCLVAVSSSIDDLREALENGLHRPVVDETGLSGVYDFKVQGEPQTTEEFLELMRQQVGLTLEPEQRTVEIVVVRQQ
jgi:uncharacterized protein (TIGR03435 family)